MMPLFLLLFIALQGCISANAQQKAVCSQEQAIKAEEEAGTLGDAEATYLSYLRFWTTMRGQLQRAIVNLWFVY